MTLIIILLATFLSSILSLIGGLLLLVNRKWNDSLAISLISFAAGTLLATAFLDLLPESLEQIEKNDGETKYAFFSALLGIVVFFFIERYLLWFHHHHEEREETKPSNSLILIGDSVHNFIDGILIAGSFLVSIPLGLATSFAVFLHEIPQEISDFSVLLYSGMSRSKVIFYNLATALTSVLGAILGYFFLSQISSLLPYLLALGAGMFVYISGSDLIPEVHKLFRKKSALIQSGLFLAGILTVWLASFLGE